MYRRIATSVFHCRKQLKFAHSCGLISGIDGFSSLEFIGTLEGSKEAQLCGARTCLLSFCSASVKTEERTYFTVNSGGGSLEDMVSTPKSVDTENFDNSIETIKELDIFAQRKNLPEVVHSLITSQDPAAAGTAVTAGSHLTIRRRDVESLMPENLEEILRRLGEDSTGTPEELSARVYGLLAELRDVLLDSGADPHWSVVDEEAEEQRAVARVFTPHEVADMLVKARAEDVAILDLRAVKQMRFADHFVLATARSDRHMMAAAGAVAHELKQRCVEVVPGKAPVVEGDLSSRWVCVDAGSVLAHVFLREARQEFDLESLWAGELGAAIERVAQPETVHTMRSVGPDWRD
uniref:Iojap-like protein n=1 Tax=Tetraselmis sp. GSL018 TaxID=582737 RepID=A0A061R3B5_9CHLO